MKIQINTKTKKIRISDYSEEEIEINSDIKKIGINDSLYKIIDVCKGYKLHFVIKEEK